MPSRFRDYHCPKSSALNGRLAQRVLEARLRRPIQAHPFAEHCSHGRCPQERTYPLRRLPEGDGEPEGKVGAGARSSSGFWRRSGAGTLPSSRAMPVAGVAEGPAVFEVGVGSVAAAAAYAERSTRPASKRLPLMADLNDPQSSMNFA